jgi:hypothetical protein
MSSHHFVKEGQEPALFILDNIAFRYAESLLEWVPLVMVADSVLESVLQWRIKIDVVLQCEHSIELIEDLIKDQGPVETLHCDKNYVVKMGLQYLAQNGYDAVNLLSVPSEAIFQEAEKSAHKLQVGIYSEQEKWSLISTGKFEKWMPGESTLLIRSAAPLQTEGVAKKGEYWQTMAAGIVTIRADSAFWIGEHP